MEVSTSPGSVAAVSPMSWLCGVVAVTAAVSGHINPLRRQAGRRPFTRTAIPPPVSLRLPFVPVPDEDRRGASDDGYQRPEEPQLGLPGSQVAAVIPDGDGELGERDAGDDRASTSPVAKPRRLAAATGSASRFRTRGVVSGWASIRTRISLSIFARNDSTTASRYSGASSAWTSAAARISSGDSGEVLIAAR